VQNVFSCDLTLNHNTCVTDDDDDGQTTTRTIDPSYVSNVIIVNKVMSNLN